ncbi:tRNA uridine-5-carboxymethylaminomethyl(34) synthesis GTPase MnmE [Campylobacter sp. MG1]|uniref:tRNA uridine-5-carboxymethylaminomethyl(34) synthesis GTPase MnmE n=1 Tax=Campylobacter sp. MG1 TaxID=2976332 RepID=UPI00226C87DC|nr:tRNA uridine-5-carboxymethylaminomethyl(34) synthesis GTPase MnmE [Campylobacter sp. MG1]
MANTIVALATASGNGAINIIRLSGDEALDIAKQLLSAKNANKLELNPRYAHFCKLYYENSFIDEGLIIYFKAPFSFTGEDCVEFQIHGGFTNAQNLLMILNKLGARFARAGEFSKRACLNNKMSLEKALLINELIAAKSESARKIISKNIDGAFKELIIKTQDEIIKTLAYLETAIDYADDDLPADIFDNALQRLRENAKELESIALRSQKKRGLIDGFNLAIVGKPNVGKSSLLNALLSFNRAIVSDIAGTTRDSIEEYLNYHGHFIKLVDTAGIRQSSDIIEEMGIKRSYEAIDKADIVLFIFDGSKKCSDEENQILEYIKNSGKKYFIVINKIDLVQNNDIEGIKISALNGDIKNLETALKDYLNSYIDNELVLTNTDLISAFLKASDNIFLAIDNFYELEICAFYLNESLKNLAIFGKQNTSDDLFDAMFSNFCLGK